MHLSLRKIVPNLYILGGRVDGAESTRRQMDEVKYGNKGLGYVKYTRREMDKFTCWGLRSEMYKEINGPI